MKIKETKVHTWTGRKDYDGNWIYKESIVRRNHDVEEIIKWMRQLCKIEAFGLKEIPIFQGSGLARFIDVDTLKNGWLVCNYVVSPEGLYRKWVGVNEPRFTNTGTCGQISCLSKESLMMSILKYKNGKRVNQDGKNAISDFVIRYYNMVHNGGVKRNWTKIFFNALIKEHLRDEHLLDDNYTKGDIDKLCKRLIKENDLELTYDYDEALPEIPGPSSFQTF